VAIDVRGDIVAVGSVNSEQDDPVFAGRNYDGMDGHFLWEWTDVDASGVGRGRARAVAIASDGQAIFAAGRSLGVVAPEGEALCAPGRSGEFDGAGFTVVKLTPGGQQDQKCVIGDDDFSFPDRDPFSGTVRALAIDHRGNVFASGYRNVKHTRDDGPHPDGDGDAIVVK